MRAVVLAVLLLAAASAAAEPGPPAAEPVAPAAESVPPVDPPPTAEPAPPTYEPASAEAGPPVYGPGAVEPGPPRYGPPPADPARGRPSIDSPQLSLALGASAFADGTLHGTPIGVAVGARIPGRPLWVQVTGAYGPTRLASGAEGSGGELRAGPRVIRCGLRGYVCGGAGAEIGWAFERHDGRSRHAVVVDTRVHLLIGFDRAARLGLDLDLGVRGRVPVSTEHPDDAADDPRADPDVVGATPGVVAGAALFVRY